jgi:hypothetical protein
VGPEATGKKSKNPALLGIELRSSSLQSDAILNGLRKLQVIVCKLPKSINAISNKAVVSPHTHAKNRKYPSYMFPSDTIWR